MNRLPLNVNWPVVYTTVAVILTGVVYVYAGGWVGAAGGWVAVLTGLLLIRHRTRPPTVRYDDTAAERVAERLAVITKQPMIDMVPAYDRKGRPDGLKPVTWRDWLHVRHTPQGQPTQISMTYPGMFNDGPGSKARADCDQAVTDKTGRAWTAVWDTRANRVTWTVTAKMPGFARYRHVHVPQTKLPLGITDPDSPGEDTKYGRVAVWDVSVAPHMLATGETGWGKTASARAVAAAALRGRWQVAVADAKGDGDFLFLAGRPGVIGYADTHEQMCHLITRLRTTMEERYRQRSAARRQGQPTPADARRPILLIVDEVMALIDDANSRSNKAQRPQVVADLMMLARKARSARIHCLLITQRPDADKGMPGELKRNLGARFGIGPHDRIASQMTYDDQQAGLEIEAAKGRGLLQIGQQRQRVQAWWLADPEDLDDTSPDEREEAAKWFPDKARVSA